MEICWVHRQNWRSHLSHLTDSLWSAISNLQTSHFQSENHPINVLHITSLTPSYYPIVKRWIRIEGKSEKTFCLSCGAQLATACTLLTVSRSDFPLLPSDKAGLETRESYINNYQLVSPVPIHQNGSSAGISKISNYDYTSHHLLLNTIFSWKCSKYKCFKHSKSFNILIQSYYSRPEW